MAEEGQTPSDVILAVRLCADATAEENPDNLPGSWPLEVRELKDPKDLPGPEWQLMTQEEYEDHLLAEQSKYEAWKESQQPPAEPESYTVVMTPDEHRQYQAWKAEA